jgi:transposase
MAAYSKHMQSKQEKTFRARWTKEVACHKISTEIGDGRSIQQQTYKMVMEFDARLNSLHKFTLSLVLA